MVDSYFGNHGRDQQDLKNVFFIILDSILTEMNHRFGKEALLLTEALLALCPSHSDWLSESVLLPLIKLAVPEVKRPDLKAELHVGRNFIHSHFHATDNASSLSYIADVTRILYPFKDAFPVLYSLYASAMTLGASTAICENSFSTLTRLLSPSRRSMLKERLSHLTLLAFEKHFTSSLRKEEFLAHFRLSNRRLII